MKQYFVSALCLLPISVFAELGTGTIQDPVTLGYTDGVYRDWQEGIVLDATTGNYVVTYKDAYGFFNSIIFEPSTKIEPILKSKFKTSNSAVIAYEYKLRNSEHSKQSIDSLLVNISGIINSGSIHSPKGWDGLTAPIAGQSGLRLSWFYDANGQMQGLAPGKTITGFSLESGDLPGVGAIKITGAAVPMVWPGSRPEARSYVGQQFLQLENNNFTNRFVAIPWISIPSLFDAAAVLTSMQKHVNQDLVTMNMIDPAFASQLDRLFQTAIAAAKGGNTVALKGNLKDLRHMLKQEHANVDKDDEDWDKDDDGKDKEKYKSPLIDKLAAKVLDFDLKYIQKRLGHND